MPRHDDDLVPTPSALVAAPLASQHHTLKHHLLGPSLGKAGEDGVDQRKVSDIIYNASKGSKYFANEENKDKHLTVKISRILAKKRELERLEAQTGLKNEMKRADEYVAELEYGRDLTQAVVHVDCDAFYAAVEELDRPELQHVPFAVGVGVLTTCNYVARKYGCRSGMAGFVADKLCPQLIHIPLNFDKYTAKAKEVRAVLEQYDPRFESASIDEAYLNITKYCQDHSMTPEEAVQQMRGQVHDVCKITISAGIAANARLAKICSNKNKPNGQFRLPSQRSSIMAFMRDLPTRKVNGVGRVFERELDAIGIKTCGDIYEQRHYLSRLFGEKAFQFLMSVHLGLGRTEIRPAEEFERKSVGTESTFHDLSDPIELRTKLRRTAEELEKDLRRTEFKGRTLVLKIKLHTYEVLSRQVQPPKAVGTAEELYRFAVPMLRKLERESPGMRVRLMGLRCTHLLGTKKGEIDFFGRARVSGSGEASARGVEVDEDGWQKWPPHDEIDSMPQRASDDEGLEQSGESSGEDEAEVAEEEEREGDSPPKTSSRPVSHPGVDRPLLPAAAPDYTRHANGFAWRSLLEAERACSPTATTTPPVAVERWNCPICSLPQPAEERGFNAHIDACLSRQTIREIVGGSGLDGGGGEGYDEETGEEERGGRAAVRGADTAKRKRGKGVGGDGEGDGKRVRKAFFA